ncbi:MAG TPA: DoxX family protein [Egibacteraceae bacterium]|jgi:putative oxidoreductase|nr:DoxX family protein [Egibacteraceae bacterium]
MSLLRRLARPLLASAFVANGLDSLRHPGPKAAAVKDLAPKIADEVGLEQLDAETLVRVHGGAQVAAGGLLALGRLPRTSALVLAASVVSGAFTTHRFWEQQDATERERQQTLFLHNMSLLGGLLIAAVDTEGRPGLGWRTKHTAEQAKKAARRGRREGRLAAKAAAGKAKGKLAR